MGECVWERARWGKERSLDEQDESDKRRGGGGGWNWWTRRGRGDNGVEDAGRGRERGGTAGAPAYW